MRNNPYDDVKIVGGASLPAQSFTGSTAVDGSKVDTSGADNAVIYANGAEASGSPSAAALVVTLQESADGSTNWSNALDNTSTVIGFTLNCESAAAENVARIEGLNLNRKRYLRAVITPAFTGGTSPAILGFAQIILGNSGQLPVDTTVSNT
jgi:hypothetical protein